MRTNRNGRLPPARAAGFTLIELLVAVTLLVMIMLATTYIFSSSTQAISEAMATTELQSRLAAWDQTIRKDLASIDHQHGFLGIGGRTAGDGSNNPPTAQAAYGSLRQAERELSRRFRSDWLMFTTNNEQTGGIDNWTKCQSSRVFYGHGRVTDGNGWSFQDNTSTIPLRPAPPGGYSKYATDWIVMRTKYLTADATVSNYDYSSCDVAGGSSQYGSGGMYQRTLKSIAYRDFRWHGWTNGQWVGSYAYPLTTPMGVTGNGNGQLAIYEPLYYHYAPYGYDTSSRNKYWALAHCAQFRIQYALPADLRANPTTGGVLWHDPPVMPAIAPLTAWVASNPYPIPYPVASNNAYRLLFAPGDGIGGVTCGTDASGTDLHNVWPALLRITVEIFDPDDRVDDGRTFCGVYAVP